MRDNDPGTTRRRSPLPSCSALSAAGASRRSRWRGPASSGSSAGTARSARSASSTRTAPWPRRGNRRRAGRAASRCGLARRRAGDGQGPRARARLDHAARQPHLPRASRRRWTRPPPRGCAGGAVLLGSTTTPEFGWKAVTDNPLGHLARNPWDMDAHAGRIQRRRRGGAALGMGALHVGTDGGGSIRIPASFAASSA